MSYILPWLLWLGNSFKKNIFKADILIQKIDLISYVV